MPDAPVMPRLETPRLLLREWREEDLAPHAALNADPRVMEFFPRPLTRDESDRLVASIVQRFRERGFGIWAVEVPGIAPFVGFVGLAVPGFRAAFTPCVEIGWRLAFDAWGHGYATEAAREVLRFGFETAGLAEIVSFTTVANLRSRRVMERLGMVRDPTGDFDHPNVPVGHPLRPHVLYRLARAARPLGG